MQDHFLGTRFIDDEGNPNSPSLDEIRLNDRLTQFEWSRSDIGERAAENIRICERLRELLRLEKERKLPIEDKARHVWELYHSTYVSDLDKDDWMSRKKFPATFMTVEKYAAAVGKVREQNPNWFEAVAIIPQQQVLINLAKNWTQFQLEHPDVGFNQFFRNIIRNGLITSQMYAMVSMKLGEHQTPHSKPETTNELMSSEAIESQLSMFRNNPDIRSSKSMPFIQNDATPRVLLEAMDPAYVWLDSYGHNRYIIWQTRITTGDLLQQAEVLGYDMQAVKRCIARGCEAEAFDNRDSSQQGVNEGGNSRETQEVILTHLEGTLPDTSNGRNLFTKKYLVVANGYDVVYGPADNPFWDQKSAIVYSPFIETPNAVYGKSPITENADAFEVRHDMINMLLDYFQKVLEPPYEVNRDRLEDKEEGCILYPNKAVYVNTFNGANDPVVRIISPADLPPGFWQFSQWFQTTYAEHTGLTQDMMGMPRSRGRVTAGEFNAREAQGGSFIVEIFKGIEERLLQPLIHRLFLRSLQYTPNEQWDAWVLANKARIIPKPPVNGTPEQLEQWKKLVGEWDRVLTAVSKWDNRKRYERLGGFFRFVVRIFSSLMERQAVIEQVTFFLQTIGRIPQALQKVRIEKMMIKLCMAFGWDPEEVLSLDSVDTPIEELDSLKVLLGEAVEDQQRQVPDFFGLESMFGGLAEPIQADTMDTTSGSPFQGTGAPKDFPIPPKGF